MSYETKRDKQLEGIKGNGGSIQSIAFEKSRATTTTWWEIWRTMIGKDSTSWCKLILTSSTSLNKGSLTDSEERLQLEDGVILMLCYLATGMKLSKTHHSFIVYFSTVSKVVKVCDAIITEFEDDVPQTPSTVDEWWAVAKCLKKKMDPALLPGGIGWHAL